MAWTTSLKHCSCHMQGSLSGADGSMATSASLPGGREALTSLPARLMASGERGKSLFAKWVS